VFCLFLFPILRIPREESGVTAVAKQLPFAVVHRRYEAQCLLYEPPGLTFKNCTFCPHSVFVWFSEQTAIISICSTIQMYSYLYKFYVIASDDLFVVDCDAEGVDCSLIYCPEIYPQ